MRTAVVVGPEGPRRWAERIAALVCSLGVADQRRDDVLLAVHETLVNAVEHGHGGRSSVPVAVDVRRSPTTGQVRVRITDRALGGVWRTAGPLRRSTDGEDRGRGKMIVAHLADRVTTRCRRGRSTVTIRWDTRARPTRGPARGTHRRQSLG